MQDEDVVGDNLSLVPPVFTLPRPGDLVVAKNFMKSRTVQDGSGDWSHWPTDLHVNKGDACLVVQSYTFHTQFRMVVLLGDKLLRFAQKPHRVALNWERLSPSSDP